MKKLAVMVILIATSGCSSLFGQKDFRLPFGNVSMEAACPAQKDNKCAPRLSDKSLRLHIAPIVAEGITMPDGSIRPDIESRLGVVYSVKDRRGYDPRFCATNPLSNPFKWEHVDFNLSNRNGTFNGKYGKGLSVSAGLDIANALSATGAIQSGATPIRAAVFAALDKTQNDTITASFSSMTVNFSPETINRLYWSNDPFFRDCRALLRTNKTLRIVDGMTVFFIKRQTLSQVVAKTFLANLDAELGLPSLPGLSSNLVQSASESGNTNQPASNPTINNSQNGAPRPDDAPTSTAEMLEPNDIAALETSIRNTLNEAITAEAENYFIITTLTMSNPHEMGGGPLNSD